MDWQRELNETIKKIDKLQREKEEGKKGFSDFVLQSLLDWKKDVERSVQRLSLKSDLKRRLEQHVSHRKEVIENRHKSYEQIYEELSVIKNHLAGGFDSKSGIKVQKKSEDKRKRVSTGEELACDLKKTCTTKGWF